jgi:hypothetical protein
MANDVGDLELEAGIYNEFAGALEACARGYRRAAGLLRFAGGALQPVDLEAVRAELAGITRRTIAAQTIAAVLTGDPGGRLK